MCKGTVIAVETLWIDGLQFSFISSMMKIYLEILFTKKTIRPFDNFFENQLLSTV